ncbi:MAG: MFS transporter, partial [Acidimicrobiia bacterium]
YAPEDRPRAYGIHRAANPLGQFLGPLLAGTLAGAFGWRLPFLFFGIPTLLLVLAALRLREPPRGAFERGLTSEEGAEADDLPSPRLGEAFRQLWRVRSLRRIWFALPFVAVLLAGLSALFSIFYEQTFGLNEAERGFAVAIAAPAQVVGLLAGIPFATRMLRRGPGLVLQFLAVVGVFVSACFLGLATAPNVPVAVVFQALVMSSASLFFPGVFTILSLILPPRVRSLGFSLSALWFVPGLLLLPMIGRLADSLGPRVAIASLVPALLIAGVILSTAGRFVPGDIEAARRSALEAASD